MDIWTIFIMNRIFVSMIALISSTLLAQGIDIHFKGAIVKPACDITQNIDVGCAIKVLNNGENIVEKIFLNKTEIDRFIDNFESNLFSLKLNPVAENSYSIHVTYK